MANALGAFGTLLKRGDGGGSEAFTTIAEVTALSGPTLTRETIDVTHHGSASQHREHIGSLKDSGDVSFSINWQPDLNSAAGHGVTNGLLKDYKDATRRNFQVVWPDTSSTTFAFTGVITSLSPTAPIDGALTADVTIKVVAEPTLA